MPRWNLAWRASRLFGLWALLAGTFVFARVLAGFLVSKTWAPSSEFWGLTAGISLAQLLTILLMGRFRLGWRLEGRSESR